MDGVRYGTEQTTPDDIWQNYELDHAPREMGLAITGKIAEVVRVSRPLGNLRLAHRVYAQRTPAQWEWVHPEIPLARMIIEAEIYSEEFRKRHEWESFAKDLDPEDRKHPSFEHDRYWQKRVHEIRVWRAGAHFIMKDTYEQRGRVWVKLYEPEIIGPVVVEQTTCEGMLMPYQRSPLSGAMCTPDRQ